LLKEITENFFKTILCIETHEITPAEELLHATLKYLVIGDAQIFPKAEE